MYTKRKKTYERHNIWRSYSDMMAGLLLLFVLVMCISFMQAQKNYQERLAEEAAHQKTQNQLLSELEERENLVASQQSALDEQSALLASQQKDLDAQSALVTQQQEDLDRQAALVLSQQSELEQKNSLMLQQQAALDEQEALMAQQQQKIEQIIGIKADLISDLKQEFDQHSLNVVIDEADGSIALDSNVLFGYNENELTEEGNTMLSEILPVYCKVLMSEKYRDYLAEVRIDGYTDTSGDYLYNLQLSQERALAVANYLMAGCSAFLTDEEQTTLQAKLTANGHSMSNPVYSEDGQINMDASRRVEIKFSLKDEEMINELKQILDQSAIEQTPEASGSE
ncbi:MAG: OmpA family protein [Lachnospiraceae bacterium]|nr:OmpA family protein [Lachnospiraceae bacterium]